jgi:hypothetical protein
MNPRFSIRNMTQAGSLNFMILTVCVAICLTAWLAIAKLQASENNMDHLDASFQNAAQAQRAYNLAFQAALQDPRVARAIARAKRSGDPRDIRRAKALFREKKEDYIEKISDMRASGQGWGYIAKQLDLHPSIVGLGHSKYMAKHDWYFTKRPQIRSEIKAATTRNYTGEVSRGHAASGSISKSKSSGIVKTKDWRHDNGRGRALGHSKSKGGNNGGGKGGGNSGGNK